MTGRMYVWHKSSRTFITHVNAERNQMSWSSSAWTDAAMVFVEKERAIAVAGWMTAWTPSDDEFEAVASDKAAGSGVRRARAAYRAAARGQGGEQPPSERSRPQAGARHPGATLVRLTDEQLVALRDKFVVGDPDQRKYLAWEDCGGQVPGRHAVFNKHPHQARAFDAYEDARLYAAKRSAETGLDLMVFSIHIAPVTNKQGSVYRNGLPKS